MAEVGTQTDSSPSFIAVRDEEMKCEPVELPLDKDDSLAIATLQLEFPSAAGLKYKLVCFVCKPINYILFCYFFHI